MYIVAGAERHYGLATATDADIARHEGFIRRLADYLFPEWLSDGGQCEDYEDVCQEGRVAICEAFCSHTENGSGGNPVDSYVLDRVKSRMVDAFRSLTQTCEADEVSLDSLTGWGQDSTGDGEQDGETWEPAAPDDPAETALLSVSLADTIHRAELSQRQTEALQRAIIGDIGPDWYVELWRARQKLKGAREKISAEEARLFGPEPRPRRLDQISHLMAKPRHLLLASNRGPNQKEPASLVSTANHTRPENPGKPLRQPATPLDSPQITHAFAGTRSALRRS